MMVKALLVALFGLCATEDDAGTCVWNAQEQGNLTGSSFFVLEGDYVWYFEG